MENPIRERYKFSTFQWSLQSGANTETEIVRHSTNALLVNVHTVLVVKSAFVLIPRQQLYRLLKRGNVEIL